MNMSRRFALATMIVAAFAIVPTRAGAAALSLVGSSTKVCQLTGENDWVTHTPTAAQTYSHFGLDGVDLGFPVDSGPGPLYLLFGDSWPMDHPAGSFPSVPPDDSLGWTTRTAPPDAATCLDLKLAVSGRRKFAHPIVQPAIKQGAFDVPSGGVVLGRNLYAFFWTDHCAQPAALTPNPATPLTLPPSSSKCIEKPAINSVGRSVLAKASLADPVSFSRWAPPGPAPLDLPAATTMPSGFVYVTAAKPPDMAPGLGPRRAGIYVFGAARYRASIPYLAFAPAATFDDPNSWSFFAGRKDGNPVWISREKWESGKNASGEWTPPNGAEIYDPVPLGERCVGEHSVTWNEPLHAWLVLYNCHARGIEARAAPNPWGPWSPPIVLLSVAHDPGVVCNLIMNASGCPGLVRRNFWPGTVAGGFYAPFVMNRFTREAGPVRPVTHMREAAPARDLKPAQLLPARRATIYWLVSTWNPYEVVVMRSTLELAE